MKQVLVFISVCILSAFLGWIAGYNFDKRDLGVASWALFTVLIAYMASVISTNKGIA